MNQAFFERLRRALAPQYRLERELGGGGMGTVYLARDANLDIPVAIKVMRPEIATATASERFLLEGRVLARLRHPNIVQVHFADERDGLSFYVMDYLEGETLDRRLEKGALSESEVINLGLDLLAALETAHGQGVLHRDIKPSNIKFLPEDRAILIDFGIAKSVDQERTRLTPSDQWSPVTLAYAAPEQLGGEEATAATDIYALGMVLFEAATGRRWITGASPGDVDWTGVRGRLARALRRALNPSPTERWPDAASFRKTLSQRSGPVTASRVLAVLAVAAGIAVAYVTLGPGGRDTGFARLPERDIAVLPFRLMTEWEEGPPGEDIAIGVARELESTTEISSVPTQLSFSWWDSVTKVGRTDVPERDAARALNARYAAQAELWISQDDGSVQARLSVYNASGEPVSNVPAIPWSQPVRLSGRVALALATIVLDEERPDLSGQLSDRSWEAVRDWMRGEVAFRRGAWVSAVGHYQSAVEHDSTFILALWGLANAHRWVGESGPLEKDFRTLHERYGRQLGSVDSTLMAAQLAAAGPRRFDLYRRAWGRDQENYFAAFLLGEELFNRGPLFGIPLDSAVAVLEDAANLNPRWTAAHVHLAWAYIRLGQKAHAYSAIEHGARVSASPKEVRFGHPEDFRLAYFTRFQPTIARQAVGQLLTDTGRAALDRLAALSRFAGSFGVPGAQVDVGDKLVRAAGRIRSYRADGHIAQGLGLVALGRLDDAITHFDSMAAILATPEARLQAAQWRLIPTTLGLPESSASAAEARDSLLALDRVSSDSLRIRIAWTLMLDAYGRDDRATARGWEDSLTTRAGPLEILPLSGLGRALRLAARGDFEGALDVSESLREYQVRTDLLGGRDAVPAPVHDDFDRAALHLLRARWYRERKDWEGVERELMWYNAVDIDGYPTGTPPQAGEIDWALGVFAEYLRGLNDMRRGDESAACAHLGHAIETWRDAEPPFLELVGPMRLSRPRDCEPVPAEVES